MSSLALPAPRVPVIADRLLRRTLVTDIALVLGGALLTALLAQVYIPLPLVPITGQTVAVLLVGATLGANRGALSMVAYAALGMVGLPVFSEAQSGVGVVLGATGGYIVGFVLSAYLVGRLSERAWDRTFLKAAATFVAGTVVTFLVGLPWLAAVADLGLQDALANGLYPFLLPGLVKALFVAALLPAAWWGAEKIAERRASDED